MLGVVKNDDHYPVIFCEAVRCVSIFGRYVKSRFKRLIFDKKDGRKAKAVRDTDFLGAKMRSSVREIAENWITFVPFCLTLIVRKHLRSNSKVIHRNYPNFPSRPIRGV